MSFQLVDQDWRRALHEALRRDGSALRIICPFIKRSVVEQMLAVARPTTIQVITRFDCCAFYQSVSDLSALRLLRQHDAAIRGVKNVHAKVYLTGSGTAIVTSANLTAAALGRNAEFGFVSTDQNVWAECLRYFEGMWSHAGADLSEARLKEMEQRIGQYQKRYGRSQLRRGLPDFGVDLGIAANDAATEVVAATAMPPQAFVKFWGISRRNRRLDRSTSVFDDVVHAGSYLACTYPRQPRSVRDGAVMLMGRMVRDPNDIIIQGRARAREHRPEFDVASDAESVRRPFMKKYRYLIRVENPEFIDGTLGDGVSLNGLMSALGANAFRSTQMHAERKSGNIDPRLAYRRHPSVELSADGFAWINSRLEAAFAKHGKISQQRLNASDGKPLPELFDGDEP